MIPLAFVSSHALSQSYPAPFLQERTLLGERQAIKPEVSHTDAYLLRLSLMPLLAYRHKACVPYVTLLAFRG